MEMGNCPAVVRKDSGTCACSFWDEMMREMRIEWFEPYHQVLDASRGPEWAQWFIGGQTNIAHNCLDRWADTDRLACLWEGENGATRSVTFR